MLKRFEFVAVVRTEDTDVARPGRVELAQALLITATRGAVRVHDVLVGTQARRNDWPFFHLAAMQVGVPSVQKPTSFGRDCNAGMALSVAAKGNQQDFRRQSIKLPDRVEAEPDLALRGIEAPIANIVPHVGAIALTADKAAMPRGRGAFDGQDMDPRAWKILDAARMVEVEVRENNVTDVAGFVSKRLNLT